MLIGICMGSVKIQKRDQRKLRRRKGGVGCESRRRRSLEIRQEGKAVQTEGLRLPRRGDMGNSWPTQLPVLSVRIKGKETQCFIYSFDKYLLDTTLCFKQ